MAFLHSHYRHERFSLREKRLLGYQQTPENAPRVSEATREKARVFLESMRVYLRAETDPAQQLVKLNAKIATINSPELAEAIVAESIGDSAIHPKAVERAKVLKQSAEKLAKARADAEANKGKEGEKGFFASAQEQWKKLPEGTRRAIAYGSGAVAAVAVATLIYKFGKWFIFGAKKAKDKATSMLGTAAKWILGTAVVSAVAGAGWYGAQNLGKLFGFKKAAELKIADMKKRCEDLKRTVAECKERGEEVPAKVTEELIKIRREKERSEETDETETESPEETSEESETEETVTEESEPLPDNKDSSLALVSFGLTRLLKNRRIPDAIDVLKEKRLGDVLACCTSGVTDQSALLELLTEHSRKDTELVESVKTIVEFCAGRQTLLKITYDKMKNPEDPEFEDMLFGEYVSMVGSSYALVQDVVSSTERHGGDLTKWDGNAAILQYLESSPYAQKPIKDVMEDVFARVKAGLSEEELEQYEEKLDALTFADIVQYASQEGLRAQLTVGHFREKDLAEGDLVGMILQEIVSANGTLPDGKFLAPFFHEVLPGGRAWSRNEDENHSAIEKSFADMNVSEAMRLYFYKHMIDSDDVAQKVNGIAMTQYEILRFIQKEDKGQFFGVFKSDFKTATLGLGADIANGSFVAALTESGIPEEVIKESMDLLSTYGPDALKYGAYSGLGPMKFAIESWMSGYRKWPVLTAGATYLFVPPVRWATNAPFQLSKWALTRTDPKNAVNVLRRTEAFRHPFRWAYSKIWEPHASTLSRWKAGDALDRLSTKSLDLGDTISELHYRDLKRWLRGGAKPEALEATFIRPLDTRLTACQERLAELRALGGGTTADDLAELAKLERLEEKLTDLVTVARHISSSDDMDDVRKALITYARPIRERLGTGARGLAHWKTVGWVAGIGMQGAMLWADWEEWSSLEDYRDEVNKHAQKSLLDVKKRFDNDPRFAKIGAATYIHKTSRVEVDLSSSFVDLGKIDDVYDQRSFAQGMRTATSAGVLGSMALMGPRLCMGPAGLVVVGVEVAIRIGISAKEGSDMRAFLMDCPPWLLAYLGSQATTGKSEYDWLRGTSSWMISDFWPDGVENAKDKKEIQSRMLFTMFYQDIAMYAPEVAQEIMAGMESPDQLNEFYKTDFQQMILPTFHALLLRQGDGNESWESVRGGGGVDSGWMIVPPNYSRVQISVALRESAALYTQHVRESRYLFYVRLLDEQEKDPGTYVDLDLKDLVASMGDVKVFGSELSSVSLEEYDKNKKRTRAEIVMEALYVRLNTTRGGTRTEKLTADHDLYSIPQSIAAGLPSDIDLSSMASIASFLDNPALSQQLQQVLATTLDEESAVEEKRWNDWQTHFENLLVLPGAPSETSDSLRYGAAFWVGDKVAALLGEPKITPKVSLFGALTGTRSGDGLSFAGAQKYITTGMERFFEHPDSSRTFFANNKMGEKLYGPNKGPVVYTSRVYTDGKTFALCRELRYPDGLLQSKELELSDLKTVFFEGVKAKGEDEYIVMATYIFGDPKTGKVSVAKQAVSRAYGYASNGAMGRATGRGTVEWSTASVFLKKPGAEAMLGQSAEGQIAREEEVDKIIADEKRRDKEQEKARAERARKWREEIAPKDFITALDIVDAKPDTYVQIGKGSTYLMFNSTAKRYVTFQPQTYYRGPSMSAGSGISIKYGANRIRPSKSSDINIIKSHSSKEGALYYYQNSKVSSQHSAIGQDIWGVGYMSTLGQKAHEFIRFHVTRPVTRDSDDVDRIIDMADQILDNPRFFGSRKQHGAVLKNALGWRYEAVETDAHRAVFLNELLQFIRRRKNTIDSDSGPEILKWFTAHSRTFGLKSW